MSKNCKNCENYVCNLLRIHSLNDNDNMDWNDNKDYCSKYKSKETEVFYQPCIKDKLDKLQGMCESLWEEIFCAKKGTIGDTEEQLTLKGRVDNLINYLRDK